MGCTPTLMGYACPVIGNKWAVIEYLPAVNFSASEPVRPEMKGDLQRSLLHDLKAHLPSNMLSAAADNYFAGKMIARIARILLIAEEQGLAYCDDDIMSDMGASRSYCPQFTHSLQQLRSGVEIWFNGSAAAPQLYDRFWGGLVNCGCTFASGSCLNTFPDCPALSDPGMNFGNGFYDDHHFQYGYHIYAAAVLMKLDPLWARKNVEHVLLYVRDIANPSPQDKYFPVFRHKDWYDDLIHSLRSCFPGLICVCCYRYMGFSWANGIIPLNLNGRNEESSSEAIAAYEAVALLGRVIVKVFDEDSVDDKDWRARGTRMWTMGRLLCGSLHLTVVSQFMLHNVVHFQRPS
jgi:endo-1,3(4)-beta-glucanase